MGWFIFSRKKRVYISLYNFQDFEYPLPCRAKGKKDSGASLKRFVSLTSLKLIKLITSPTSRYLLSGKKETIRPSPRDWSTILNNTLLPAISIDTVFLVHAKEEKLKILLPFRYPNLVSHFSPFKKIHVLRTVTVFEGEQDPALLQPELI